MPSTTKIRMILPFVLLEAPAQSYRRLFCKWRLGTEAPFDSMRYVIKMPGALLTVLTLLQKGSPRINGKNEPSTWNYFGESMDAFGDFSYLGPFNGHVNGACIMKEMRK
jgi:hypothetical protein